MVLRHDDTQNREVYTIVLVTSNLKPENVLCVLTPAQLESRQMPPPSTAPTPTALDLGRGGYEKSRTSHTVFSFGGGEGGLASQTPGKRADFGRYSAALQVQQMNEKLVKEIDAYVAQVTKPGAEAAAAAGQSDAKEQGVWEAVG